MADLERKGRRERKTNEIPFYSPPPPPPLPLPTFFNTFTVRKIYGDMSVEDIHTFLVYGRNPTSEPKWFKCWLGLFTG